MQDLGPFLNRLRSLTLEYLSGFEHYIALISLLIALYGLVVRKGATPSGFVTFTFGFVFLNILSIYIGLFSNWSSAEFAQLRDAVIKDWLIIVLMIVIIAGPISDALNNSIALYGFVRLAALLYIFAVLWVRYKKNIERVLNDLKPFISSLS